jgi:hypothetical protein
MDIKKYRESAQKVLKELNVKNPELLGKGGEGFVFSYSDDEVIKIYHHADEKYLNSLKKFQTIISNKNLSFDTPLILKIGKVNETYYTIEKRLHGVLMESKFPPLTEEAKYHLLNSYYNALKTLNSIEFPDLPYGNVIEVPHPVTDNTWTGFLIKMLTYKIQVAGEQIVKDITNFDKKVALLTEVIKKEVSTDKKSLVHADYFVNQVLVNEKNEISAILDISYHAIVGDRRLDVAGVFFFEGMKYYTDEHIKYLLDLSIQEYGESILKYNDIYRLYYCFYFSEVHTFMPDWYQTLLKNLNDEKIWNRINNYLQY